MTRTVKAPMLWLTIAGLSAFACVDNALAQEKVSFAGKNVTVTIGFEAGNRVDLYARMLGSRLSRNLPGEPNFVFVNRPGAGGVIALNEWNTKAEPNGLNITVGGQTQVDQESLSRMQSRYQPAKFRFVGGLGAPSQGLLANKAAVGRLTNKAAGAPVTMGVVGSSLRSGYYQVLWGAAFLGWNVKWVQGYQSTGEARSAVERGEVDMSAFGSSYDIDYLLNTGKIVAASQSGAIIDGKSLPRAALGSAPIISNLVTGKIKDPLAQQAFNYGEKVVQTGMFIALPPGTADNIVDIYVQAFEKAVADPQFQTDWLKVDPDSPTAHKADLEVMVRDLGAVSPEALNFIRDELRRQGVEVENK